MAHFHHSSEGNEDLDTSMGKQLNEIRRNSRTIEGLITRYILNTRTVSVGERLKREAFGEKDTNKPHKTILLVGETGTGKSTVINAMVNYLLGVESKDRIWCEIIETKENQPDSQTNAVTVYDVFPEHGPLSLTIIDTPGFGSTDGIQEDLNVTESLHELFRSKDGVDEIDAVCLVVKSGTNRLTERKLYVFNAVLSLFGNDVEKNIVVVVAHAGSKPTNAIKVIKESRIRCAQTDKGEPVYFRFNNSHCEDFNHEEILEDYEASLKLLNKTMESFLTFLKGSKAINLKMTESVLRNRKQLTASISNLKDRITLTELKQKALQQAKEALEEHEGKGDHDNWEYEVDEPYKEKVPIEYSWRNLFTTQATCCNICKENCHYPGCWWVRDLSWCSVMSKGKCTVCPGKCRVSDHTKENKIYVAKTRKVKKTKEDLKRKYETESGEKKSLMNHVENEIKEMKEEKKSLVNECYECVTLLEEIALKPDSVFTLQHLDYLIEKVKETGDTPRVQKLEEIKRRADKQVAKLIPWFSAMQMKFLPNWCKNVFS